MIKLPLGIHQRSGRYSCFLLENGRAIDEPISFLRHVKKITLLQIEKIIAENREEVSSNPPDAKESLLDMASAEIRKVVNGCAVIAYLLGKAETTRYLSHRERIILLQTFGLMGETGKEYLHKVMRLCINYNQAVTERYLNRVMPKPISCARIREDLIHISASLDCDCRFRRGPGFYPAPLLYARGVWGAPGIPKDPVRQNVDPNPTAQVNQSVHDTSPYAQEIEELLEKMNKLRQHQQGVNKALMRCEARLDSVFNSLHTDQVITRLGRLIREKGQDKTIWSIRL